MLRVLEFLELWFCNTEWCNVMRWDLGLNNILLQRNKIKIKSAIHMHRLVECGKQGFTIKVIFGPQFTVAKMFRLQVPIKSTIKLQLTHLK